MEYQSTYFENDLIQLNIQDLYDLEILNNGFIDKSLKINDE